MMDLNEPVLEYFSNFIYDRVGIVYTKVTYYQLESRLENAVAHFQLGSVVDLQKRVQNRDPVICKYILDIATNNETSFFRDPKVFRTLGEELFKPLATQNKSIRIWSAACSTGQEPYSLAMDLSNLKFKYPSFKYEIIATDFSYRALDKAKNGIYTQLEVQRGLDAKNLVKYFTQDETNSDRSGGLWKIKPEIQKYISFSHFNLLEPWSILGQFDLILCRNVLIYQKQEKRTEILSKMASYLKDGGFLTLGCAESITNLNHLYTPVQYDDARFYQKGSSQSKMVSSI